MSVVARHLNCGWLHAPPNPRASCHCLLLEAPTGLALIDTGVGLHDVRDPEGRIGRELIELVGFQFREEDTALRQVERLGFRADDVRDIVLTHADPDHAGGLADFPFARVHLAAEELDALSAGNARYLPAQFAHEPRWEPHAHSGMTWFGLPARPLNLGAEVLLVPLFGHTSGHCGVAVRTGGRWLLHAGDAYYLRVELERDDHPVSALAAARAEDDVARRRAVAALRRLTRDHALELDVIGYHDVGEFPPGWVQP
ncbi:MBL fold metallo-hydrolase [Urbifossiella limnaea]|uniref:Metallo-beta-lactamase superfamily protein n=1 Tax=Urbifossiella limnaea TaxID=2528023 RepID=A0A517XWW0_9BACT|nr:MBL fold metallo-hydrolase [Urbifossiella limnaea]QDU22001.1 Metallo-beta-lactamase superfamily protein [Urbifossiella limnaea]